MNACFYSLHDDSVKTFNMFSCLSFLLKMFGLFLVFSKMLTAFVASSLVLGAAAYPTSLQQSHCDQSWAADEDSLMSGGAFVEGTTGGTVTVASSYDSTSAGTFTVTVAATSGYRSAIKVSGDDASGKYLL